MNDLIKNPLKLIVYDPETNTNKRTYVFVGTVPSAVASEIARSGTNQPNILKEFYGPDYKSKLCIGIKDMSGWMVNQDGESVTGGDELYDDLEELLKEPKKKFSSKTVYTDGDVSKKLHFEPGVEYVYDVQLYPEDNFEELKNKIHISVGIPAYRQHLFYLERNRVLTTYNLISDGFNNIDIRKMHTPNKMYGISVDKFLYDNRENIKVEALDTFNIVGDSLDVDPVVYVVDLAQFTNRVRGQILEAAGDSYQFDLFYYGFVIKYWPQLTQECFYDYITNENELVHKYPELAKDRLELQSIHKNEKAISTYNYDHLEKATREMDDRSIRIAITQMVAFVAPNRILLNIRNMFNEVRVSRIVPEIHAYVDHGSKKYMFRKKHIKNGSDIQFPSGTLMKNGLTLAISLKKADQDTFHAKSTISTMENEQSRYLFLNIWPDGRIYVRTLWNEEDELGFDMIVKIMKKFTDPLINYINSLGKLVFIVGNELPLITKQNIKYHSLNICVFWKKVVLEATFKVLRTLWEQYMKAKITSTRNVQQFDKYEFVFKKGMHQFDLSNLEKILNASNNISLNNQYSHLSNNSVRQKWDQNYGGRVVKMSHRTTDVRFEIADIREREFQIFHMYIQMYVYRTKFDERFKKSLSSTRDHSNDKKLRKLREQDPELYNLKKYGSKKVYSYICQKKRQPLIYTADEIKAMNAKSLKSLTQYWNFTLNRPAYYSCPDNKYPHLSFMVGVHPKQYCLPCCNKRPQHESEKKAKIAAACMQKHKYLEINTNSTVSRHVMGYGKEIDLGRLSKLPQGSFKNLLLATIPNNTVNYYLYGVHQHVPGVEHVGIVYALAEAFSLTMGQYVEQLLTELKQHKSDVLFYTLLNGSLTDYFPNVESLISAMTDYFLDLKLFSQELMKFDKWPELFIELSHIFLNINTFVFVDETGNGAGMGLYLSNSLKNEMIYVSKLYADTDFESVISEQKCVVVVKRKNKFYPVFLINHDSYFKSFAIESRIYTWNDKLVKIIYEMAKHTTGAVNINKIPDLPVISQFVNYNRNYSLEIKYINRRNLCYAVLLKTGDQYVYVPVDYSVYISDGVKISFDVLNSVDIKYSTVERFLADYNQFVTDLFSLNDGLYSYALLSMTHSVYYRDKPLGVRVHLMLYYITHFDTAENLPRVVLKYSPLVVNELIVKRCPLVPDNRSKMLGEALYNNYLYQLLLLEFANYLDNERNSNIRKQISDLVTATNFKKDLSVFRNSLKDILENYPEDYEELQQQIIAAFQKKNDKKVFFDIFNTHVYEFDKCTLNKLKKLPPADVENELKIICEKFTARKDFDSSLVKFPDIYLPCVETKTKPGYCDGNRLIINRDLDELVSILASDILDSLKSKYLLTGIWQDTHVDFIKFTKRPTEIISIFLLNG